ncbi:unnamed protein product, partial [marine sediment metagenome]
VRDALQEIIDQLDDRSALASYVMYLTSDAGEGKTTLLNYLAKTQAKKYLERKSNWLLLPIPLAGRPFLRFDDIIISSLMNRLRFPHFFFDSFIELVKMGAIVPAFDGFEEMFIESSTGEAISALANLLNKLSSEG